MLTRSALFFPLVLAVLLALLTFWINQTVEQQGPKIDGSNRHDPDYTMHNFVTTQTDATGRLSYILAATEMLHYPDDDSTVLQRPRFTQYTLDKPYTQIEGLHGYVSSNGEQVTLVNNVKVVRQAFEGKGEMQVLTEKLLIFPKNDLVKTDAPVRITQAPKTVITGVGMIYDKKEQTVTLLNRVKVHYERPPVVVPKQVTAPKNVKVKPAKTSKIAPKKSASAKLTGAKSAKKVK
ncbi:MULTISPECIES: LPS export ABC transporter periplasmic protein LptC [Methylotenera]|uniref:LPS export ABC transporter periplasmic protein LptC n=1 Tax=Methylotenera TaxID=359407 RepID=UPI00036F5396|nr:MULTISPECIES: LPS export ABC transporter periplasmic protein LptC [Methylotenera]